MTSFAICTIVSKNYLAHARSLVESFQRHHPGGEAFVLLADRVEGYFDASAEPYTLIEAHQLGIPDFEQMAFRYNITEFNTAVKPYFMEFLFARYPLESLVYFDPDIYIYRPLSHLQGLLTRHSIVLTPHVNDFLDDGRQPDDVYILRAGVHNLGFIAMRRGPDAAKLLTWWKARLLRDCVVDFPRGIFVDQRWIDLVPSVFDQSTLLRDPGHNAAYWNLSHRRVEHRDGEWYVNGQPLVFFHFSGLPADDIGAVSKYQDRVSLEARPELRPLFEHYHRRLLTNGLDQVRGWPYAYGRFSNGAKVIDPVRYLWRNTGGERRWPQPFVADGAESYYAWLQAGAGQPGHRQRLLSRLAIDAWAQSWYLQQKFPDPLGDDATAYATWHQQQPDIRDLLSALPGEPPPPPASAVERKEAQRAQLYQDGPPTLRRRLYYAVRDPIRRLGLAPVLKRFLGARRSTDIWRAAHRPSSVAAVAVPPPPTAATASAPDQVMHATGLPAAVRPPDPLGVNLIGYLRAETGVGEAARSIARSLRSAGVEVALTDLTNPDWARSTDVSVLDLPVGLQHATNLLVVNADMVPAACEVLGPGALKGRFNIGFWHWETANFPERWQDRFNYFDEIWVDSSFLQKALGAASPIPITNVHLAINSALGGSLSRQALGLPEDRYLFFFSFDAGSYIQRKNPFAVIEAYRRAFGPNYPGVGLVIKAINLHLAAGEADRLQQEIEAVGGILRSEYMDREALGSLFNVIDAYVSLHRSEGFGLTMAEAMLREKPVIATAYSGNMEFMNPANSFLVGFELKEIDGHYGPYQPGDVWADADIDQAVVHMRYVVSHADVARRVGARAALDIKTEFGTEAVGARMRERLRRIASRLNLTVG